MLCWRASLHHVDKDNTHPVWQGNNTEGTWGPFQLPGADTLDQLLPMDKSVRKKEMSNLISPLYFEVFKLGMRLTPAAPSHPQPPFLSF